MIGIIGFGFVGQAVYSCLEYPKNCYLYDPPKKLDSRESSLSKLEECLAIFCCLPTMTADGRQDFSAYKQLFEERLRGYKGLLIIKSTVLYENISKYEGELNIVHNPEFLCQNSSYEDFYNQDVILLGGRVDLCRRAEDIYVRSFKFANKVHMQYEYCTLEESCNAKYIHNIYHSYKALFWNYVHEVCKNHRKMFKLYSKITGNTFEMQNIYADGKAGFGGACFPKDVAAFHRAHKHQLTDFMLKYNHELRGEEDA